MHRTSLLLLLSLLLVQIFAQEDNSGDDDGEPAQPPFKVDVEVLSPTTARLSWGGDPTDGNEAVRHRILCTAQPDGPSLEAAASGQTVDIDTFLPGREYICEVHPIWDEIVEGMEVIAANPGVSNKFLMPEQAEETEKTNEEEPKEEGEEREQETSPRTEGLRICFFIFKHGLLFDA